MSSRQEGSIRLDDEAALQRLATRWAPWVRTWLLQRDGTDAAIVHLQGELGAGKSTFVRALLRALGYDGAVPSPTYTLIESYVFDRLRIAHADFYRLSDPAELEFLGIDAVLGDHQLLCIEWPERAGNYLPPPAADIRLEYLDQGGRQLFFSGALAHADLTTRL